MILRASRAAQYLTKQALVGGLVRGGINLGTRMAGKGALGAAKLTGKGALGLVKNPTLGFGLLTAGGMASSLASGIKKSRLASRYGQIARRMRNPVPWSAQHFR